MRLILFFDLPSTTDYEKKEYQIFHKNLIRNGFIMMQFSVYIKSLNSFSKIKREIEKIRKCCPKSGNVRLISITETQYKNMEIIIGHKNINEIYNTKERYIKI